MILLIHKTFVCCNRAAAKREKSVLHLDPAGYYGSQWTSFQLDQFLDWSKSHGCDTSEASGHNPRTTTNTTLSATHVAQQESQPAHNSPRSREPAAPASLTSAHNAGHPGATSKANEIGSEQTSTLRSIREEKSFLEVSISSDPGTYTNVEVQRAEGAELGPSREYNIDVAPRVRPSSIRFCNAWLTYRDAAEHVMLHDIGK